MTETANDVQRWFTAAIAKLWPFAEGCLSLRRCPCIRENCASCKSGKGHSSYVLYIRQGKQRTSIYIPDDLAPRISAAMENGRRLQELINEATVRYTRALKRERRRRSTE
jgi:hypothetical protein